MTFYHGSPVKGLDMLVPKVSSHKKPYIYFATNEVVATFYMVHVVEKPYGWYSYGFDKKTNMPIYYEYYPNALKDVHAHRTGYLYECDHVPNAENPTNINCAYVCENPVKVDRCRIVPDVYEQLLQYEDNGKLIIKRYETLNERQKENSCRMICNEIIKYNLIDKIDDSYGKFLKSRFPSIWESVKNEISK